MEGRVWEVRQPCSSLRQQSQAAVSGLPFCSLPCLLLHLLSLFFLLGPLPAQLLRLSQSPQQQPWVRGTSATGPVALQTVALNLGPRSTCGARITSGDLKWGLLSAWAPSSVAPSYRHQCFGETNRFYHPAVSPIYSHFPCSSQNCDRRSLSCYSPHPSCPS
jgi:hypothetical protein